MPDSDAGKTSLHPESSSLSKTRRAVSRRKLLRAAPAGAAAVAGMTSLPRISFAQDTTPAATPGTTAGGTQVVPGQIQYPSGRDGVPDAWLALPEPFISSAGAPGSGGTVRVLTLSYDPPPPGRDSNQFWQELERRLNVTWEVDLVPQPQYGEITSARLAGGDLPDIFYLNPGQNAPQQWQALQQGAFQPLTDYLTGDALQQFPNLAQIPEYVWNNVRFQGEIYGVPATHSARFGNVPFHRSDWAQTVGMAGAQGPDQVRELLRAVTQNDPNGNGSPDTWGAGRYEGGWLPWDNTLASTMFRVPVDWVLNPDGTLTSMMETEEYRQAVTYMTQLYQDGSFHPDAANMTFASAREAFVGGSTSLHTGGFLAFWLAGGTIAQVKTVNPVATVDPLLPVGMDGQPGVVRNTPGYFGMNAIPASIGDEERVLELLRILDYLASPFGSEEWTFLGYGIEGVHFERSASGDPIVNDLGRQERSGLIYLMPPLPSLYLPDNPELALSVMDYAVQLIDMGIDPPTRGLFSPTDVEQGPSLAQFGGDSINGIITGRSSLDELDSIVAQWRERGGDQIRTEFQEALQERG